MDPYLQASQLTEQQDDTQAKPPRLWQTVGIAAVMLVGGFWLGNNYDVNFSQPSQILVARNDTPINDPLYRQVQQLMESKYLDKSSLNQQQMLYGAIAGMVSSAGDPYTSFFNPDEHQDAQEQLSGKYEGIGAQLGFKDRQIVVVAPLKDSPAMAEGVRAGDAILKIDDQDTVGMSLAEAVNLIRGQAGTNVKLVMLREGELQSRTFEITRQEITIDSVEVSYQDDPATPEDDQSVAVIAVNRFGDSTNQEWDAAVSQVRSSGAQRLILDLRDNPGGYLDSAIHIASEFFRDGVIVSQQGADGRKQDFTVDRQGRLQSIPVAVIINQGSASASEIVAGALQSRDRAVVVGQHSFGKGSVQQVIDLPQSTSLHVTIAKWLLPNGQNIDKQGIQPDVAAELTEEDVTQSRDPQLDAAIQEVGKR